MKLDKAFHFTLSFVRGLLLVWMALAHVPVFADPISKEEAEAWVTLVRRLRGAGADFDVKLEAQARVNQALDGLRVLKGRPDLYRDLGDGLHTLGHMAEHEHRFERAVDYHRGAFNAYSESRGLPTRESWHDGRQHAVEHIFMNIYDLGIYHERLGSKNLAHRYFDAAFGFALMYGLQDLDTERLTPRYDALVDRFEKIRLASGVSSIKVGTQTDAILGELKCASHFVSAD